jgi:hypothetical protein
VGEIAAGEFHTKLCFELARSVFIVESFEKGKNHERREMK